MEHINVSPSGRVNTPWKKIPRNDGITLPANNSLAEWKEISRREGDMSQGV